MTANATDPSSPSRSWRRERALRATRQRLKRLEIETHRIKAELARLESENETDLANELTQELRVELHATEESVVLWPTVNGRKRAKSPGVAPLPGHNGEKSPAKHPRINAAESSATPGFKALTARRGGRRRKKSSSAWLASLCVHGLILLLLAPMTFVMLTNDRPPLLASMFTTDATDVESTEPMPIELVSFEQVELPEYEANLTSDASESVADELDLFDSQFAADEAATSGQLNTLPTDVGTLMVGGGDANGQGRRSPRGAGARADEARLGRTSFFSTQARANRVVFLVDNSASMKQGRMETTLFELARSVEQLGEKQEFYVVFYSDQAYPMMYPASVMEPLAATRENKQRLYAWLQTVELCVGGALLKAVELAESLKPDVVYLLSDGDITGTATMERLARPSERKFSIHTLGMGVKKPQDAQNLALIAQANRGTFHMVGTLPAAVQMSKARPMRSNPFKVAWGQGNFAAGR